MRGLVARFDDPTRLRAWYEAGPMGYELARLLRSLGVRCEVIAPSLIPTAPGTGSRSGAVVDPGPVRRRGGPPRRLPRHHLPGRVDPGQRGLRPATIPAAGAFMGFCGLVPSEYSSGERTHRGHITHAGNLHLRTQLIESAWADTSRPNVGPGIARRHHDLPPEVIARAWTAERRLTGRFRRLDARKTSRNIVVTAIARELAGFVWAEMTTD